MNTVVSHPSKKPIALGLWIAFAFFLVVAAGDIFVTIGVFRFQGLYHDLGVVRLPWYTALLIQWRFMFVLFAFSLPVIAFLVVRFRSTKVAITCLLAFGLVAVIQTLITMDALIRPLHYPYTRWL